MARLIKVVAGVAAASAAVGAMAGMACAGVVLLLVGGTDGWVRTSEVLQLAAFTGASCGVVLGPLAGFGFLRRVPLGRLFAETSIGTVIAGVAAFFTPMTFAGVIGVATGGFFLAASRLAWVYRAAPEKPALEAGE
jgi:hypothetical protein